MFPADSHRVIRHGVTDPSGKIDNGAEIRLDPADPFRLWRLGFLGD
jgi:hypothetical protein